MYTCFIPFCLSFIILGDGAGSHYLPVHFVKFVCNVFNCHISEFLCVYASPGGVGINMLIDILLGYFCKDDWG